jgi:RNA polymerase sigma-70 factor (ECF subfamily)
MADAHERFLALFLRHQADLRAFLASVLRDRAAVEDLFQETALVLWKKFDEYDPARPFGAWARGVAAHKVLQERARRVPLAFSPEAVRAVAEAFDRAPEETDLAPLRDCVSRLPEKARRLLALRYGEGLALGEIGRRVGGTLDAVHKALSRAREAVERCLRGKAASEGSP